MRFAVLTDLHFGDPEVDVDWKNVEERLKAVPQDVSFVVHLGDIAKGETKDAFLRREQEARTALESAGTSVHYVMGNQEQTFCSEKELESRYGRLYYSFERDGQQFVVLFAASQKEDAHVAAFPEEELAWLKRTVRKGAIVFSHWPLLLQELDGHPYFSRDPSFYPAHMVPANAEEVRQALEGKAKLVLQGHVHRRRVQQRGETTYVSLPSFVHDADTDENRPGAYAIVDTAASVKFISSS